MTPFRIDYNIKHFAMASNFRCAFLYLDKGIIEVNAKHSVYHATQMTP